MFAVAFVGVWTGDALRCLIVLLIVNYADRFDGENKIVKLM